jgi:hypothetical protein
MQSDQGGFKAQPNNALTYSTTNQQQVSPQNMGSSCASQGEANLISVPQAVAFTQPQIIPTMAAPKPKVNISMLTLDLIILIFSVWSFADQVSNLKVRRWEFEIGRNIILKISYVLIEFSYCLVFSMLIKGPLEKTSSAILCRIGGIAMMLQLLCFNIRFNYANACGEYPDSYVIEIIESLRIIFWGAIIYSVEDEKSSIARWILPHPRY